MSKFFWDSSYRPAVASEWNVEELQAGIFLARSESETRLLSGTLIGQVLNWLDGTRSIPELAQAIENVSYSKLLSALDWLADQNLIAPSPVPELTRAESAYWRLLGADDSEIAQRCKAVSCRVTTLDPGIGGSLEQTVADSGIRVTDDGGFHIVVARDYLDPRLAEINSEHLRDGTAWMLVRPYGRRHWIGPLLIPRQTGCWRCLAWWLTINDWSTRAVVAELPMLTEATLSLAGIEAVKWLLTTRNDTLTGRMREFDTGSLTFCDHPLLERPGCPSCHPTARPRVELCATVSPLIGVAARVKKVREWPGIVIYRAETSQRVGVAGSGVGYYCSPQPVFGVAECAGDAETVCLAEAAERYSVRFQGNEAVEMFSYGQLGARGVEPAALVLASRAQLAARKASINDPAHPLPEELCGETRIAWLQALSLVSLEKRLVPAGHVYFGYDPAHFSTDTNGCAAGATVEAATLAGLLEIIERDAVALWWYNRAARPAVDLVALRSTRIDSVLTVVSNCGCEVHVLDLTTDFEIPVCVAVAAMTTEGIALGMAAHPDPESCAFKALSEMCAGIALLENPSEGEHQWLESARIEQYPHLRPRGTAHWGSLHSRHTLGSLLARSRMLGLDVLMVELTRPELGLPVVRVIVPGTRSLALRLAPGRLYDVPVKLGWLPCALSESQMNPTPFSL